MLQKDIIGVHSEDNLRFITEPLEGSATKGNLVQILRGIQESRWKSFDPPPQNHRNPRGIQESCTLCQVVVDPSEPLSILPTKRHGLISHETHLSLI